MAVIMLLTDAFGRPTYGVTEDPTLALARLVVEGRMDAKQAMAVPVHMLMKTAIDRKQLDAKVARLRELERYRRDPGSLLQALHQKKMTPEQVEGVRVDLVAEYPLENFEAPWPQQA